MSNHDFSVDCDIKGEKRQLVGKAGDFDVYAYQRGMGYPARYGARSAGGVYSRNRHLPRPYPYTKFSKGRGISVGIIGGHPTGPMRHLSPQISVDGLHASKRSNSDFKTQYPDISERARANYRPMRKPDWSPFAKWTNQKLGFMSGQRVKITAGFPIITEVRKRIVKIVGGR